MKKPKNSRFAAAGAAAVFVVISEATFFFREKQETIFSERQPKKLNFVPAAAAAAAAKSVAVPTTRAIPADANTNLTIGDIIVIIRQWETGADRGTVKVEALCRQGDPAGFHS